jgi:hypothetical protein
LRGTGDADGQVGARRGAVGVFTVREKGFGVVEGDEAAGEGGDMGEEAGEVEVGEAIRRGRAMDTKLT